MRKLGLILVIGWSSVGLTVPAHASTCAQILAHHYTDETVDEVAHMGEMEPLGPLIRRRLDLEDRLARLAADIETQRYVLAARRGGLTFWESRAHARGIVVTPKLKALRQSVLAWTAAQAEYDDLLAQGSALELDAKWILLGALDRHAELTGDDHLNQLELANTQHRDVLDLIRHVMPAVRDVLREIERLTDAALPYETPAPVTPVEAASGTSVVDELVRVGGVIDEVFKQALATGLLSPRTHHALIDIIRSVFARTADQWRVKLGFPKPLRQPLFFLRQRLRDVEIILRHLEADAQDRLNRLNARENEILIRLEETFKLLREDS